MSEMIFKTNVVCPYCKKIVIRELKIKDQNIHKAIICCYENSKAATYCNKDFVLEYTPCLMIKTKKIEIENDG